MHNSETSGLLSRAEETALHLHEALGAHALWPVEQVPQVPKKLPFVE